MTPAMQQFHEVKADYPDHIVLFRMGDFYETFYDDAKKAAEILNITLTARDKEKKVPMAGIPFHALDNYLTKLIDENQKVVIVEQLEDPAEAKGVVKRGVVKIVTPGTSTFEKDPKNTNYLLSIDPGALSIAFVDIVEGTVYVADFEDISMLEDNVQVLSPKEILVADTVQVHDVLSREIVLQCKDYFTSISEDFFQKILFPDALSEEILSKSSDLASRAVFALLNYLADTQKSEVKHINNIIKVASSSRMKLDINAIRNLELIEGSRKGAKSLFTLMDKCQTANGSKKLKQWIISPLIDQKEIQLRQNSVVSCIELGLPAIGALQEKLQQIHDLYRISSKLGLGTVNARDLRNCVTSIGVIYELCHGLVGMSERIDLLVSSISEDIKKLQPTLSRINTVIVSEPPLTVREGGLIKPEIDKDLDALRDLKDGGKTWLREFEQQEIKRSGIATLKVRFNKVFGYYIEVSKGQSSKVPDYFIRKQTLVNAERYITPELKEQEANILGAEDRIRKIEFDLFMNVVEEVKPYITTFQNISDRVAEIDVYIALAVQAIEANWTKPSLSTHSEITIKHGRHPVIEYLLKKGGKSFVSNSVLLQDSSALQIITGPNMGGKSTFIRQVALIVLLAQIGSFVPAESATIGVVDRIFTRVGASDNLSQGESTFMVEMLETAEILNNATEKSLVILDEVGRGTSTFDGMSIAWAICEYLQKIGAKTLFATHYHELTELSNKYKHIKNLSVKVIDYEGEVVFMHQIIEGKADKSYGIHVAKLAKLPGEVIRTAEGILKKLEKEKNKLSPKPADLFETGEEEEIKKPEINFAKTLETLDVNQLTPVQAIQILSDWKNQLQ